MTSALPNPFNPNLPFKPEDREKDRLARELNETRFREAKKRFAQLQFERPGAEPYDLLRMIFTAPEDASYCLQLATQWPDGEILAMIDAMKRPGVDRSDVLPDKEALAMRYMQIADNTRLSADVRLKALGQYQTLMGMDPPKAPVGAPASTFNTTNIFDARRVFVLPNNLTPEQWEEKNSPSRPVKQLELAANDTD